MRDLAPGFGIDPEFADRMKELTVDYRAIISAALAVENRENWCERINPGDATTYVLFFVFEGSNCWFGTNHGRTYPWGECPLEQNYVQDKWADSRYTAAVLTGFLNNVWRYMEVD